MYLHLDIDRFRETYYQWIFKNLVKWTHLWFFLCNSILKYPHIRNHIVMYHQKLFLVIYQLAAQLGPSITWETQNWKPVEKDVWPSHLNCSLANGFVTQSLDTLKGSIFLFILLLEFKVSWPGFIVLRFGMIENCGLPLLSGRRAA